MNYTQNLKKMLDIPEALELDISYKEPWDVVKKPITMGMVTYFLLGILARNLNFLTTKSIKQTVQVVKRALYSHY